MTFSEVAAIVSPVIGGLACLLVAQVNETIKAGFKAQGDQIKSLDSRVLSLESHLMDTHAK